MRRSQAGSVALFVLFAIGIIVLIGSAYIYFEHSFTQTSLTANQPSITTPTATAQNNFDWISILNYATYPPTFLEQNDKIYINSQRGKELISAADPQSFYVSTILDTWAKDKNSVYFTGSTNPVPGADPLTFSPVAGGLVQYARDKNSIYCAPGTWSNVSRLTNGDPATFQILYTVIQQVPNGTGGFDYAKDKNNVYVDCQILIGADAATFKIANMSTYDAQDKSHTYLHGQVVQ